MKWILIIAAVLVLIVGAAAAIGAILPRGHHATRRARFRAAPDVLYAVLAGPPDWRTGIKAFGNLPDKDGRKQWWEEDMHHQRIVFELVEASPPARLVVRIAGRDLPFGGTWTFDIARDAQGAALRITEDGEVYNVIFRFMARFVFGYTGSIETYLRDLGGKLGEPVEIEA
jgi:hypothetical protein